LLTLVGDTYERAVDLNFGKFTYALDDTYIHMSIARHFAEDGVWGTTRYAFTSATSSPLWTLLLAGIYFVFGVSDLTPLWLNIAAAVGLLFAANFILRRMRVPLLFILAALIGMIYMLPMQTLIFSGMEHTLHALLTVIFLYLSVTILSGDQRPDPQSRELGWLWIVGALLIATRYEGAALVALTCVLFIARRWYAPGIILGVVSFAQVTIYGLYAMSQGWGFLPSSIALNTETSYFMAANAKDVVNYIKDDYLLDKLLVNDLAWTTLLSAALLYLYRYQNVRRFWDKGLLMLLALAVNLLLQVRLVAWEGPLYRYEMYLLTIAIIALVGGVGDYLPRRFNRQSIPMYAATAIAVVFLLTPWLDREEAINARYPLDQSMNNIFQQQYQMAQFLNAFYDGAPVVANDIGAINYYADIQNIDLWGLGNWEVAESRLHGYYTQPLMDQVTKFHGGRIALVYDSWFENLIPEDWILAGQWEVEDSVVLGDPVVSFYATNPAELERLPWALWIFSSSLPPGVIERGEYLSFEPPDA
jgi:hypothetical protein